MRMLDETRDQSVSRITILLTRAEAEELRDSLDSVLGNGIGQHTHILLRTSRKRSRSLSTMTPLLTASMIDAGV